MWQKTKQCSESTAQAGVENAFGMLRDERFSSSDLAVVLSESVSSRDLGTVKASKTLRARRLVQGRGRWLAECWVG
jgi:hypothetical protein